MGGDHPFTWYQYFDGGRSFFTSLGHTVEIYKDENYKKLIRGAILWASSKTDQDSELPVLKSLMLDLNPDEGVTLEKGNKISFWQNSVTDNEVKSFKKQDKGRKIPGSGMPRLKLNVPELNGHNSVVFHRQELLNENEDAFDHLTQGSGYTWLSVMAVYEQVPGKPGVNSFFGNLRNTNLDKQGNYEGFWAGLNEENQLWMGSRNAKGNGLWHVDSPHVINPSPLNTIQYYLVIGRMQAGTNNAKMELFVNGTTPVAEGVFPVNPNANPSKMAIGQERDATNHPGHESFDGEIARFLIYDRPLLNNELNIITNYLIQKYNIQ